MAAKMKVLPCLLCIMAIGPIGAANASRQGVTPVQKVIELLSGMLEKGKKAKHEEQVLFAESRQFCGDKQATQKVAINQELLDMDVLDKLIEKDTADAGHLLKLIATLDENQDIWSGDIKAATKVREIERADYKKTHEDYTESISALERAIAVLKKTMKDRKQRSSLAQVTTLASLDLIPAKAKKAIDMFLQQGENSDDFSDALAPEANAYEAQSSGIIDMLDQLHDKFIDERTSLEKEEQNARHSYEMMLQELKGQIEEAIGQKDFDTQSRAKVLSSKASETSDLNALTKTELSDEEYLKDLVATCQMEETDFEARQNLRAAELENLEKALEILSGAAVSGNAEKHLPTLVQKSKKSTSFSQLRSNSNTQIQNRVAEFLRTRAKEINSRVLAKVAQKVAEDPFAKVKKIVKDLIVRLMEEANEEAEHKGWCDTELGTNEQTRKEKTAALDGLHASVDEIEAELSKIGDDITTLSDAVAALDKSMAEASKIRSEETAKNAETVSDAQDAQTAIAQAMTVLKEFYSKASEATSFAQIEPYKGMQEANGGVVGMLEVIETDFARLESETKAAEATSQKEFDTFMEDSKVDKAAKSTDIEHKTAKKQDQSQALTQHKEDLEETQKQLDTALAYYDKLKPDCVDSGASYEDRSARRKQELESLQEALKVVNGDELA